MARNNTLVVNGSPVSREKTFLFEVDPFFMGETIDFLNKEFFPQENPGESVENYSVVGFPTYNNPYLNNEVRGFIQHMVVENHNAPSYVKSHVITFVTAWNRFVNDKHPEMESVVDYDYEQIYMEYVQWLNDHGIQVRTMRKLAQVTEDMEWLHFPVKSTYVAGFGAYYKYIDSIVFPDLRSERVKDVWDVRRLGVPYHTLPSRPRYTVNYSQISQPWLKETLKSYNYYRVQTREMSTVLDDMKAFNLFSEFLRDKSIEITSLAVFDRELAEAYIGYVRSKGFVASTFNRRISAIKTLFAIGNMMDMEGFPTKPIFTNSDYAKVVHKLPVPFSDNELRQMNEHISELPTVYGRVFFVLENCGMRMSDLVSTRIDVEGRHCIQQHGEDKYIFLYEQPKVHKTNTIPISPLVAEVIRSAIEDSRAKYGDGCKYIFAKSQDEPIGEEDFVMAMNKLSKRNGFVTDLGRPLRIKGHTFRRTKATEYANMGVGMDVIRIMLGQSKIGVLKHYVTIHSATMIDALSNITAEDETLIRNIGNEPDLVLKENAETGLLPLSNGFCAKGIASGLCDHAYACYSCRMYRPSKQFLPLYERQLREACNNISVAELNGYERLLQVNTELKEQLEKIIRAVRGGE